MHDIGRLTRLGFTSLPECLLTVPKEYRDFHDPIEVLPLPDTGLASYMSLTLIERVIYDRAGAALHEVKGAFRGFVKLVDGRGQRLHINLIGKPSIEPWMGYEFGATVHTYGEVVTYEGRLSMSNPMVIPSSMIGRVMPVYQGKQNQVSAEVLGEAITAAMAHINEAACLLLEQALMHEDDFRKLTGLVDPADLLRNLHTPLSVREGEEAVRIAKAVCIQALVNRVEAHRNRPAVKGALLRIDRAQVADLIKRAPFSPSADQLQAIDEIVSDLRSPYPMQRILSGDVSTGKSFTFMVPAAASYLAGAKVAIIAPGQILAQQLAAELSSLFYEIPVVTVVGPIGKAHIDLTAGIVVGTTAVLSAAKKAGIVFDLVIADEQQRFSVAQRSQLIAAHTNYLEATATAIPRTVALVKLGGLPISILRTTPVPREIVTRIITHNARQKLHELVMQIIKQGGQVAFIYPVVNGEADTRNAVENAYERFRKILGDDAAMIHGGLPETAKADIIDRMKAKQIKLLVASTVIEVGVTFPGLTLLIAVNPEHFGVAQLHQLRGRVARKGGRGYFIMYLPNPIKQSASSRLRLLTECNDGFVLAEMDAESRGYGDLSQDGETQSGATRALFWGLRLSNSDITSGAVKAGLIPGQQ
uniref:ATP-dependent DNA helicase RecG n=1 Tax=Pseudomonas putida TaxID=303 RepID=A0A6B7PWV2_PSEPU|nr:helicase-related protein [Pseudomonas putida]QFX76850.1 ATP-dependent DNA helicase RecG [Pseudomonas putida]